VHGVEPLAAEPVFVIFEDVIDHLGDPRHFLVRGDIELRERALAELPRRDEHHGWPPPFAECAEERHALRTDPAQLPPLIDDQRPAHDREDAEQGEDRLGNRPGLQDEIENVAAEGVRGGQARLLRFQP
jgi:hypothetical protein